MPAKKLLRLWTRARKLLAVGKARSRFNDRSQRVWYIDERGRRVRHSDDPRRKKSPPSIVPLIWDLAAEAFTESSNPEWSGTPEELLNKLREIARAAPLRRHPARKCPSNERQLLVELKKSKALLQGLVLVQRKTGPAGTKVIAIKMAGTTSMPNTKTARIDFAVECNALTASTRSAADVDLLRDGLLRRRGVDFSGTWKHARNYTADEKRIATVSKWRMVKRK